jgi:hypothetical protein
MQRRHNTPNKAQILNRIAMDMASGLVPAAVWLVRKHAGLEQRGFDRAVLQLCNRCGSRSLHVSNCCSNALLHGRVTLLVKHLPHTAGHTAPHTHLAGHSHTYQHDKRQVDNNAPTRARTTDSRTAHVG